MADESRECGRFKDAEIAKAPGIGTATAERVRKRRAEPPEGRAGRTVKPLCEKLVELSVADSIATETDGRN